MVIGWNLLTDVGAIQFVVVTPFSLDVGSVCGGSGMYQVYKSVLLFGILHVWLLLTSSGKFSIIFCGRILY